MHVIMHMAKAIYSHLAVLTANKLKFEVIIELRIELRDRYRYRSSIDAGSAGSVLVLVQRHVHVPILIATHA